MHNGNLCIFHFLHTIAHTVLEVGLVNPIFTPILLRLQR